jgi:hypothetical protein
LAALAARFIQFGFQCAELEEHDSSIAYKKKRILCIFHNPALFPEWRKVPWASASAHSWSAARAPAGDRGKQGFTALWPFDYTRPIASNAADVVEHFSSLNPSLTCVARPRC